MKRFLPAARLLALCLCMGLLVSCGPKSGTSSGSASGSGSASQSTSPAPDQSQETPEAREAHISEEALRRVEDYAEQAARYVMDHPADYESRLIPDGDELDRRFYRQLTDRQKQIYDDILPKIKAMEAFTYTAEKDGYPVMDDLLMAAHALTRDYPLYDCYFDILEINEGNTTTALTSHYFMPGDSEMVPITTPEGIEALREEMDIFTTQCQYIVDFMPGDLTAYDQFRYLASYISVATSYDYGDDGGHQIATPYGAIQGARSICQGYAEGMQLLCQMADLWCTVVEGSSKNDSHGWNLVKLEDGTYHVDVTWSDNGINLPSDPGWFEYFMVTQDAILMDHSISDGTTATGQRFIPIPVPGDIAVG